MSKTEYYKYINGSIISLLEENVLNECKKRLKVINERESIDNLEITSYMEGQKEVLEYFSKALSVWLKLIKEAKNQNELRNLKNKFFESQNNSYNKIRINNEGVIKYGVATN